MRRKLQLLLKRALHLLADPPPDQSSTIHALSAKLQELAAREDAARAVYMERVAELIEARQMGGSGPWVIGPAALSATDRLITESIKRFDSAGRQTTRLRETGDAVTSQGLYGDIELALQNVEWRREVNLSWLEFSRWGIQQIILVSRLHYIKNPIIRRLIDVCAAYVFARGVEVSCDDEDANDVLKEFFQRNKAVLGQNALADLERRKDYDGNLFFVLFADTQNSGRVECRTIDATEIQEVVCDPDDSDCPWFYKRIWTVKVFDASTGTTKTEPGAMWYPALGYEPAGTDRPALIGGVKVAWESPVLHRKCGGIAKWHFGCPRIYPAIDWAKEARKYLEACASVAQSLSQIALTLTTKGGQQALAGVKQQLGTTVGPTSALWDTNPPAVAGSTFASGPGTKLEAFKTSGAGMDPEKSRQYKLMACMVAGVPETFLGDVSTGNLATATSLDRPTETIFIEKQESWREDLVTIASFVLRVSGGAPSGKLRECGKGALQVREAARVTLATGRRTYEAKPADPAAKSEAIEVRAEFPAIREGDVPALITATVEAMTLGNRAGQVVGVDEREGVRKLFGLLGIDRADEVVEEMYPDDEYEPDRTKEILPDPLGKAAFLPGGAPQPQPGQAQKQIDSPKLAEALARLGKALKVYEADQAETNGTSHSHAH